MSIIGSNILAGASGQAGGGGAYEIERSVRFNAPDSSFLSRTPGSAGNRKTWTWSGWVKRSIFGTRQQLFSAPSGNTYIEWQNDQIQIEEYSGGLVYKLGLSAVQRDPSAWYHFVFQLDTTQATAADRVKIYINGVRQTAFGTASYPSQNHDSGINGAVAHKIGAFPGTGDGGNFYYFSGYLADIHFIDGQALDPSSFGEFDTNGVWQPIAYTGSYGTNGFRLPFSDNSTAAALGTDTSSNGNTWTVNNLSVTAGAGNDSLVDSPTNGSQVDTGAGGEVVGNYATLNPLIEYTRAALANGNLDTNQASSSAAYAQGTIVPSSGKWFFEATCTAVLISGTTSMRVGVAKVGSVASSSIAIYNGGDGQYEIFGSNVTGKATYTNGDVVGVAVDIDAGTIQFYKNGSSQGSTSITAGIPYIPHVQLYAASCVFNFGQRQWAYAAPAGFKALCTTNLPGPTIADGSTVMDVALYTGNGSTQTISGLNFSPDFVWMKRRNSVVSNALYDIVRGVKKYLNSDGTGSDYEPASGGVTAFNSDGFTVVEQGGVQINASGASMVAWTWDAGSSTVTNTEGSITSSVRANASAGFSVVTYTGTGATATVGHGLGVAPGFIIIKRRDGVVDWVNYHSALGPGKYLQLNLTSAATTSSGYWGTVNSSTFGLPSFSTPNASGGTYVAYCFAPVAGYSSFGSYLSNASSDGPFVYTGFRSRWLMIKLATSESTRNWIIIDAARNTYNAVNNKLAANSSASENDAGVTGDGTANLVDFLSNGFKLRTGNGDTNGLAGYTYIWAAFAESPFQYARAR
jgi:hypothetical protein